MTLPFSRPSGGVHSSSKQIGPTTVDENIIATTEIRNNYGDIQSFKFSFFFDGDSCRSFSLLKAIAKKLPIIFANTFKSVKEQQLYGKQYRKEAMNQTTKLIQKLKQRDKE